MGLEEREFGVILSDWSGGCEPELFGGGLTMTGRWEFVVRDRGEQGTGKGRFGMVVT